MSEEDTSPRSWSIVRLLIYILLLVGVAGGVGYWLHNQHQETLTAQRAQQVDVLARFAEKYVEARRWDEARQAYAEIEKIDPGSKVVVQGHKDIEAGIIEEQEQFIGYWNGEALSLYEAERYQDAAKANAKVLERFPDNAQALEWKDKIEEARQLQIRKDWTEKTLAAIEERNWDAAKDALAGFADELPDDHAIAELQQELDSKIAKQQAEYQRALDLKQQVIEMDQGVFDEKLIVMMREAVALHPENEEIRKVYERVASYTRTIRVPEDKPSLAEALMDVRARDRIVLGEGTFEAGLSINTPVNIEGAGLDKTILKFEAKQAPVLTFGPEADGATVNHITFQVSGFDVSDTRYPAVQIRGSEINFGDCLFEKASGHGVEVMDGGKLTAIRCLFDANGWDGAAAHGEGTKMDIRESKSTDNIGHGYEVWDGAALSLTKSTAKGNTRAGVLLDSNGADMQIVSCEIMGNREYGIVIARGLSGQVSGNLCYANRTGGVVIREAGAAIKLMNNRIEKNIGIGLQLESGVTQMNISGNVIQRNTTGNLRDGITFSTDD